MTLSNLEHILITAQDNILLPGLYYHGQRSNKILAVYVHGAGSSSIIRTPKLNSALAAAFIANDVDFLAFNNRGSGYITKFDKLNGKSVLGGMAYEKIEDFQYDLNGVKEWAKQHGYNRIILIGHSTGANKIVLTVSNDSSGFIAGVALLAGGDDVSLQRRRYDPLLLAEVERRLPLSAKTGKLVPARLFPGEHPITWASLGELLIPGTGYDIFPFGRTDSDLPSDHFSYVRNIKVPTIFIYGSEDFGTIIPVKDALDLLKKALPASTTKMIEGGDHSFTKKEKLLATELAQWAREILSYNV